jgi:hypothetical protein
VARVQKERRVRSDPLPNASCVRYYRLKVGISASAWVVPGAPLAGGEGWRIWYSWPEPNGPPEPVSVSLAGAPVDTVEQAWVPLDPIPDVSRSAGILTVRLRDPRPGALYEVTIPEAERSRPFGWRTLPDSVDNVMPDRPGLSGASFLFSSCFWWNNDKEGAYSAGIRELAKLTQPAFKLLLGDQVYQDWPWALDVMDDPSVRYSKRYEQYWGDQMYRELLQCTPNYFMGDDHEFWNDYPEKQLQLPQTWTAAKRNDFGTAARQTYDFYQRSANGTQNAVWVIFEVAPVSFFISDTRSQRTAIGQPNPHFFSPEQWAALESWANGLRGPGVLTLGQPLYHHFGSRKDHTLPDFKEDFARLSAVFDRSLRGQNDDGRPHDILMLSGDIHIGRYTVGRLPQITPFNEVYELVASAASRIAPDLSTPHPEGPPTRMPAGAETSLAWDVRMSSGQGLPTLDNNVGVVQMSPGTVGPGGAPRVRFQLELWRVRPYDTRHILGRLFHKSKPLGPLSRLFRTEVELR